MSNTCERRFHPKPSTNLRPTLWIAARSAAVRSSLPGASRKCSSKWKSRQHRPSLRNIKAWRTGARTAGSSTTPRCPMPSSSRHFWPRLTALVAFMKGVCHASFSTIRKFLRDVARVQISRGYLAKLIGKVSESLAQSYAELFERLPGEPVLNIDETGHKEYRDKFWTWCFRAQQYTLFRIDKSRGSKLPDRGAGHGVQRRPGLRLLQRLPQIHAGVRRAGAVLHGAPDPRRKVSPDPARTRR